MLYKILQTHKLLRTSSKHSKRGYPPLKYRKKKSFRNKMNSKVFHKTSQMVPKINLAKILIKEFRLFLNKKLKIL